jgi:glycosyltransferase involved in cell wall biosynthesis
MRVSLIVTVKDEAASIRGLLDSLVAQTRPPDEVVIADGGSTDATPDVIKSYAACLPLRLLLVPGANIAQGRNAAICAATGEIIACTDGGVRLAPQWLAEIVRPFEQDGPPPDVVSGFFQPDPQTTFELAMGATVLPSLAEIKPADFFPSSRSVAFSKAAWKRAGGYPEWLDYCEDLIFDFNLRRAGCRFAWAPQAIAHFRPRSSLSAFFRQYYRYARGDGKADLWRKRHAVRYTTYLLAPIVFLLGFWYKPLWLLLLAGAAVYLWQPYCRLRPLLRGRSLGDKIQAVLLVPVIRLVGDVAKMLGYPVGVWWRLWRRRNHELC